MLKTTIVQCALTNAMLMMNDDDDDDDEKIDKSAQNGTRWRCTEFIMMNLNMYKHLNFALLFFHSVVAAPFLSTEVHFKKPWENQNAV